MGLEEMMDGNPSDSSPALEAEASSSGLVKLCDRCGCRLGRGTVHIAVSPTDDSDSKAIPSLVACRECAKSLTKWIDRGRGRTQAKRKPRPPRAEKKSSRRGKFRPKREQVIFGMVIMLSLVFCYYLYSSFQ
jgi:hypothetical protein